MFLNTRHAAARRHSDDGSTLVSVVIVALVLGLLTVVLSTAVINTSRITANVRGDLQSQAAADAGLSAAVATARGAADVCGTSTTVAPATLPSGSGTTSSYTATITCNTAKTEVTLRAVGTSGVETTTVQSVYAVNTAATTVDYTAGGPGLIYTYQLSDSNTYSYNAANSEVLASEYEGAGALYAVSGTLSCWTSGAVYPADLYLGSGDMNMGNGCTIKGTAYIGGTVSMQSGSVVEGALVAPKDASHTIAGTIGTTTGTKGRIDTGGHIFLNGGTVRGSVNSTGTTKSTLGAGTITGDFTYKTVEPSFYTGTQPKSIVKGSILKNASMAPPTLPTIPGWQEVSFTPVNSTTPPAAWAAQGYALTTVTGSACNRWTGSGLNGVKTGIGDLTKTLTTKMIYDIRGCNGGFSTNNGDSLKDVPLNRDVAIIANSWYLSGTKFTSNDGTPKTLYLITPDGKPTVAGPHCDSPAANSEQGNSSSMDAKIATYIYTPCEMKFNDSSSTFRGQVYAGKVSYQGGAKFSYAPRSIPGYNFGAAAPGGGGSGGGSAGGSTLGTVISKRDVG